MTSRVGREGRWAAGCPCSTVVHLCLGPELLGPLGFSVKTSIVLGVGAPRRWGSETGQGSCQLTFLWRPEACPGSLRSQGTYVQRRDTLTHVRTPVWGNNVQSFEMCLPYVASPWGWDRENGRKWAPT